MSQYNSLCNSEGKRILTVQHLIDINKIGSKTEIALDLVIADISSWKFEDSKMATFGVPVVPLV